MKKYIGLFAIVLGVFAFAGFASASTADVIQPAEDVTFNENLVVNGTGIFDSIKVGKQGVGGVTFFNGTIVNSTTDSGGTGIPVTVGDDVRIDGRVWRGESAGSGDGKPFIVNDDMEVQGGLTAGGLNIVGNADISGYVASGGTITSAGLEVSGDVEIVGDLAVGSLTGTGIVTNSNIADDAVTPDKINGTGGANLPIAYGYCNQDGTTASGTNNISCSWDSASRTYKIAIKGFTYENKKFITVVTPVGNDDIPMTGAESGRLTVLLASNITPSSRMQNDFGFVVYQIP